MAFLWKHPKSQYWMARFYDRDGKRRNRSTRTKNRKEAEKLATSFEEAARKRRTAIQARRVIAALHSELTGEGLPTHSVRDFFVSWVEAKGPETAPATIRFYENAKRKFLAFLGDDANRDIGEITREHILQFRAHEAKLLAAKSVNHSIKFLRMVFKAAKRDGAIADNPAEFVEVVRSRGGDGSSVRKPFSLDELRAVLAVADQEWKSMVLFGLYTGQRLSDIADLRWSNVDLKQAEIRLITRKTGRSIIIPLAGPLKKHVEGLPSSDEMDAPIHPRASAYLQRQGKSGGLSNQFALLLAQAGLRPKQAHRATHSQGRGIGSGRSSLSFHSLRHSAVTFLKEAGIPAATVMELVGHDSIEMSDHYTHVGRESMVRAAESFPTLF